MKIAVVANGAWDQAWGKHALKTVDFLICADGGGNNAFASERVPDLLIGDLDSISVENLKACEHAQCLIERYPREKDETDLELALLRAEKQAQAVGEQEIWLYGATGKRIDHFLGNVALMLAYAQKGLRIRIADLEHEMWILQGRETINASKGQELSLIVLSSQAIVTTEGLYYPLNQNDVLLQTSPRGVSNVFIADEAIIHVHEGQVLMILPKQGLK